MMRGIVNIEFILSVFIFLSTLSFITITIGKDAVSLRENSLYNELKTHTIQLSDAIIFDKGYPEDWWYPSRPISYLNRIGLSTEDRYVISKEKLVRLNDHCSKTNPDYNKNYEKIKELLSQKGDINLTIATDDGMLLSCSPAVETLLRPKFTVNRIVIVVDGSGAKKFGEFNITVID